MGILVHFTDTDSPRQNSRTEKAGGMPGSLLSDLLQLSASEEMQLHHQSEDVAGQVDFKSLNEKHRVVFQKAREKEVQPLMDNKAIRIMSVDEGRAFRKKFPQNVLGSRYVDRWKPNGVKFATLPESYGQGNYEPTLDEGMSAKSRWCVIG